MIRDRLLLLFGLKFMPDPLTVPSIRGGIVERLEPGDRFTATVSSVAGVSGGTLVEFTAGDRQVQTAGAASVRVAGVAIHDQSQNGKVTVATEGVWEITAAAAIVAGDRLVAAANGQVTPAGAAPDARTLVGFAVADTALGVKCPVKIAGSCS